MALHLAFSLNEAQKAAMRSIPTHSWFTSITWENATSPTHPNRRLAENNIKKLELTRDWIVGSVKGKRVLDLFCANGAFSFIAALAGAREVCGIDYSQDRIDCAKFVASTIHSGCDLRFLQGNVYDISEFFDQPFDVVLCLGGLYHVADPALILTKIRDLTNDRLIFQTSQVLPYSENIAKFTVRQADQTQMGMTSIRGGQGTWHYSPSCLHELLLHAGFGITDERYPASQERDRFPWFLANCQPLSVID